MKLKYKVAVKFYTETKNLEQLNFAYKEIENFTGNYINFKWFYKFDLEKIKNKYGYLILEELDLDQEIEILIMKGKSEFINFLDRYKLKIADGIFQKGNYNVDLVKYAIDKVINQEKKLKEEIDIGSLLNNHNVDENKYCVFNELTSSNLSLLVSFSLVILSVALIFIHYYMYMKNPLNFFKGINE